ncbi:MAG: hypothetical protein R3B07_01835 [Polyangiaceae bacterium]
MRWAAMEPKTSRHGRPKCAWLLAFALPVLVSACGGPSFNGRVYESDELSFEVRGVPSSWETIDASHALVSFRDEAAQATIAVSGRCGEDGDDVPLTALTHHLFLTFTEREVLSQEESMLDGRAVLRTEITAKLDGVPKHFIVYVMKKNNCVYDFVHISPEGTDARSRAEFDRFVAGFHSRRP